MKVRITTEVTVQASTTVESSGDFKKDAEAYTRKLQARYGVEAHVGHIHITDAETERPLWASYDNHPQPISTNPDIE